MQNFLNEQEYNFVQWTNTFAYNFVVPMILSEPWEGAEFDPITADYFRHSFTLALNGGTKGYSIVDGQAYSLIGGVAVMPPPEGVGYRVDRLSWQAWRRRAMEGCFIFMAPCSNGGPSRAI
jgi:hypothetical protein